MLELTPNDIERGGYWYLATPYSKYAGGLDRAAADAAKVAGELLRLGWAVYAPIVHGHHVGAAVGIDPRDHSFWLPLDEHMMRGAAGLIVAQMPGWEESLGMAHEIAWFEARRLPIMYLKPATIDFLLYGTAFAA